MPRILIVDDNEFNLMPLKHFINVLKFDQESIMKIMNPFAPASSIENIQEVQNLNLMGH